MGDHTQLLEKSFMLPMEAFTTTGNTEEMTLVSQIFDTAKAIADLKLSEVALSLYSAYVLLQAGMNELIIKTQNTNNSSSQIVQA